MTGKGNKRESIRCPGCGKQPVPLKRGRIQSHVTPGNRKCLWIGQPSLQAKALNALTDKARGKS